MAPAQKDISAREQRRHVTYLDADGNQTLEVASAVQGEVVEYDAHGRPARRTRFFLDRNELPWLPVSEPAFLLWVLAGFFMIWLAIGLFLLV